jgi:hypothetical protein
MDNSSHDLSRLLENPSIKAMALMMEDASPEGQATIARMVAAAFEPTTSVEKIAKER